MDFRLTEFMLLSGDYKIEMSRTLFEIENGIQKLSTSIIRYKEGYSTV